MSAPVVLDACVVLGWAFGKHMPESSRALLRRVRAEGAQAPVMLQHEAGRVLARRAAGRSLSDERRAWFLGFLGDLPIVYDAQGVATQYAAARTLAGEQNITVKDASYLELAHRTRAELATRDRPLMAAARRIGVAVT